VVAVITRVRDKLYSVDPYHGVDVSEVEPDRQGWGSDHPILREVIEKLRPVTIAELGVWKGRCALNMVRYCREISLESEIICIDTWLGSSEHWLRRSNRNFYDSLRIKHGLPQIYWTFIRNVLEENAQEFITPMPMPSEVAFHVLTRLNASLDLVHVDASHEYESVAADLRRYWSLLRPGGVLIGDDYCKGWPGVSQAADEFSHLVQRPLKVDGIKYLLEKEGGLHHRPASRARSIQPRPVRRR
jgi:SAM-dependent methyltransferase